MPIVTGSWFEGSAAATPLMPDIWASTAGVTGVASVTCAFSSCTWSNCRLSVAFVESSIPPETRMRISASTMPISV